MGGLGPGWTPCQARWATAASRPAATLSSLFGLERHAPLGLGWRGCSKEPLRRALPPSAACQPLTSVSTPALTLGRGCRNGALFRQWLTAESQDTLPPPQPYLPALMSLASLLLACHVSLAPCPGSVSGCQVTLGKDCLFGPLSQHLSLRNMSAPCRGPASPSARAPPSLGPREPAITLRLFGVWTLLVGVGGGEGN